MDGTYTGATMPRSAIYAMYRGFFVIIDEGPRITRRFDIQRIRDDLAQAADRSAAEHWWKQSCEVCYRRGRRPSIGMAYLCHWSAPRIPMTALSTVQRRHNKRRSWCRTFARRSRPT